MALNPMHQFEVYKIGPEINLGGINLSFTNASLFMAISASLILMLLFIGTKKKSLVPSKVQLITDRNFAVSVKVGKEMFLSIFKPTHGKLGYLDRVIKSIEINVGDIIYTSGVSKIYPSDLPVAKIKSIEDNPDKLFLDVVVEILADIDNLNYVFIVQ